MKNGKRNANESITKNSKEPTRCENAPEKTTKKIQRNTIEKQITKAK
jgi:hypothetical protein